MGISLFFSTTIYRVATAEINRVESRIRQREMYRPGFIPSPVLLNQEIIDDAKSRLIMQLLVINTVILVGSAVLSYWLSGKTLKPIHETLELQKRFISDASHELKTPIASIKTGLEVYLRSKTTTLKSANLLIEDTLKDIDHLNNLTKQLLVLNTNTSNKKVQTKPSDILENISKKMQPLADKKQISFKKINSQISIPINTQAFEQLAIILLDNAIKFSKPSSVVSISFSKNIFKVTDQGVGINPTDLPHIFNRFYQSETSRNKQPNTGHGLGLSIAKQLCEQNGWSITATSKLDSGTTFIVKL